MQHKAYKVVRAVAKDAGAIGVLFDLYRQFYDQRPDPLRCERFIQDRIMRSESVIFMATAGGLNEPLGFTQMYPTFCSVAADRIFVLYDLFVCEKARGKGIGRQLMQAAERHARQVGAVRIQLETHHSNTNAQRLYEGLGYQKDEEFFSYSLSL